MAAGRKIPEESRQAARVRASDRCEYCRLPAEFGNPRHQVDHVVALQHGGTAELANLAFSCARCNRHKGPNLSGRDPQSGEIVRLFNPRADNWESHFLWQGPLIQGRTPSGRATVQTLEMNHPLRIVLRERLVEAGIFP